MTIEQQLAELQKINDENWTLFTERYPKLLAPLVYLATQNYGPTRIEIYKNGPVSWEIENGISFLYHYYNNAPIYYNWEEFLVYAKTRPAFVKHLCDFIADLEALLENTFKECLILSQRKN